MTYKKLRGISYSFFILFILIYFVAPVLADTTCSNVEKDFATGTSEQQTPITCGSITVNYNGQTIIQPYSCTLITDWSYASLSRNDPIDCIGLPHGDACCVPKGATTSSCCGSGIKCPIGDGMHHECKVPAGGYCNSGGDCAPGLTCTGNRCVSPPPPPAPAQCPSTCSLGCYSGTTVCKSPVCPSSCGSLGCVSGTSTCNALVYTISYYKNYYGGNFPTGTPYGTSSTASSTISEDWGEDSSNPVDCNGAYEWCQPPNSDDECPDENGNCCCPTDTVDTYATEPYSGLGTDNYAIKYEGDVNFPQEGIWQFTASSDDGVRVFVDDQKVIDAWYDNGGVQAAIGLTAGNHKIRVEYYEGGGYSRLSFYFARIGSLPQYSCTGNDPVNAQLCSGDNLQLSADTAKTLVSSCGSAKCEYTCTPPFIYSSTGPSCVLQTGSTYCMAANEGSAGTVICPPGQVITAIDFASYGTPGGSCGAFVKSSCDSVTSNSVLSNTCLYSNTCTVSSANSVFGDPCPGASKRLYAQFTCGVPPAQLSSAVWTDYSGVTTTSADKNDRLVMKAVGTQLGGKTVTFTWYKGTTQLGTQTVTAQSDTLATYNTTIPDGTIYFKAVSSSGSTVTSPNLVVSSTVNNAPPVAVITAPISGGVYFTGSSITFTQASTDIDSNITDFDWDFGDGQASILPTAYHTYTTAGQKTISLRVTDEQGSSTTITRVIAVANSNGYTLLDSISQPGSQQAIVSSNLVITYDGSDSYLLNSVTTGTPCTATITCVQGKCPSATQSSPSCTANTAQSLPIAGAPQTHAQLFFNWSFRDTLSSLSPETGLGKVTGTKGFASYGPKNISLQLKYSQNNQNLQEIQTQQFYLFNQRQCSPQGDTWYQVTNNYISQSYSTLNTGKCAGLDNSPGTGDDCCPVGMMCSTSGCVIDPDAEKGCSAYAGKTICNADPYQRVKSDILWSYQPYHCGQTINGKNYFCACSWDTNACLFNASAMNDNLNGATDSCSYTTSAGECVSGYKTVTLTAHSAVGSNDPNCINSVQQVPCGRAVVALPFFGIPQLISVFIVVVFVYLFFGRFVSRE